MPGARLTPMPLYQVTARDGMTLGMADAATGEEALAIVRAQMQAIAQRSFNSDTSGIYVLHVMKLFDGAVVFTIDRKADHKTELQLQQEMKDAIRASANGAHDLFTSTGNGAKFATAYKTWMDLRADRGDKYACGLGYGTRRQGF